MDPSERDGRFAGTDTLHSSQPPLAPPPASALVAPPYAPPCPLPETSAGASWSHTPPVAPSKSIDEVRRAMGSGKGEGAPLLHQAHTSLNMPPGPSEDLSSLRAPAWFTCLLCAWPCGGLAIFYANAADNGAPGSAAPLALPHERTYAAMHCLQLFQATFLAFTHFAA